MKDTFRKKVVNTGEFAKLYETISRAEVDEKWDQKRFRVWSLRDELKILASCGDCHT